MNPNGVTFRGAAVARFAAGRRRPAAIALRPPAIAGPLACVAALAVIATAIASRIRVPEFVSGYAVVAERVESSTRENDPVLLVAVPAAARARLAPGQRVLVGSGAAAAEARLLAVAPPVRDDRAARARLGVTSNARLPVGEPSAFALTRWPGVASARPAIVPVRVEVERESALAGLPLVDRLGEP